MRSGGPKVAVYRFPKHLACLWHSGTDGSNEQK